MADQITAAPPLLKFNGQLYAEVLSERLKGVNNIDAVVEEMPDIYAFSRSGPVRSLHEQLTSIVAKEAKLDVRDAATISAYAIVSCADAELAERTGFLDEGRDLLAAITIPRTALMATPGAIRELGRGLGSNTASATRNRSANTTGASDERHESPPPEADRLVRTSGDVVPFIEFAAALTPLVGDRYQAQVSTLRYAADVLRGANGQRVVSAVAAGLHASNGVPPEHARRVAEVVTLTAAYQQNGGQSLANEAVNRASDLGSMELRNHVPVLPGLIRPALGLA
jgi:hypothetical protein